MARSQAQEPGLSLGNQIYLYGLLSRELGCGKQTFLPRVEEALAAERMTADELGFESTRALLEAMGDCVNLTVFKGGRIYVTMIAQPAWDEALAAPAEQKADAAAKGGRPWKRKKADKSLKPVKPSRVKRETAEPAGQQEAATAPEPAVEPEATSELIERTSTESTVTGEAVKAVSPIHAQTEPSAEPGPAVESEQTVAPGTDSQTAMAPVSEHDQAAGSGSVTEDDSATSTVLIVDEAGANPQVKAASEPSRIAEPIAEHEPSTASEPDETNTDQQVQPGAAPGPASESVREESQPSISLTITYDPYSNSDEETTLEASCETRSQAPAQPDASAETAPRQVPSSCVQVDKQTAPAAPVLSPKVAAPSPEALAGYPHDFAREVYCSAEHLAELNHLLPLGTAAMPLLAEDFQRALDLGLISGTRSRAIFPLRIQHLEATEPIEVTIRKQSGPGLPWTISRVE